MRNGDAVIPVRWLADGVLGHHHVAHQSVTLANVQLRQTRRRKNWTDGRACGRTDGSTDGRTDGRTDLRRDVVKLGKLVRADTVTVEVSADARRHLRQV